MTDKWNGEERRKKTDDHWAFDKRIPVAVLVMLVIQSVGIVWYSAKRDSDIENNTVRIEQMEKQSKSYTELLIRIDERLRLMIETRKEERASKR